MGQFYDLSMLQNSLIKNKMEIHNNNITHGCDPVGGAFVFEQLKPDLIISFVALCQGDQMMY